MKVDAIVSIEYPLEGLDHNMVRDGGYLIAARLGRFNRIEVRDTLLVLTESRVLSLLVHRVRWGAAPLVEHVLAKGLGPLCIDAGRYGGGRWPSNIVFVHASGCECVGHQEVAAPVINRFTDGMKPFGQGAGHPFTSVGWGRTERVGVWACTQTCPVRVMESQGGSLRYFPCFRNTAELGLWLIRMVTPSGGRYLLEPLPTEPIENQVGIL